jgi:hypothetical protein
MRNEKGIRFKSGAVPAAVSLNANFLNYKSLFVNRRMGRHQKEGEPEYLPRFTTIFLLSGESSKNELQFIVIHFLYWTESRHINLKLFHMEKVCPRCIKSFICRNDDILECWCLNEPLTSDFRKFLAENFSDCLCAECITDLRKCFSNYQQQITIENENY